MGFTVDLDDLGHTVSVEMLQQQHMIELDATMGRPGPQGERGPMGPSAGETFTTARSLKAWWPLQRALDAGTGVVAWMGDSKSEGTGVQREDQRALARFRVMLRDRWALPADTGVGYVPAHYYNFYPLDPQPTITGSHTPVGYEGGLGNRSVHLQPGAVVTWPAMTYSAAVGVPVHWTRMEANGSLEVLIDGTVATTINTQGTPRASMRTVVPITDGEHVVAVRASGTLAARIEGIVNESAPTGAKVHDAARSGGTLHQFTQGTVSPDQVKRHWEAMTLLQPDLIVAAFGANDMSSYTPQQWAANLKRTVELRDQYLPDAGLLLLHGAQRVEDTPGRLRQYEEAALETLADVPRVSILWESALWQPRPGHTYRGDITDPDDWLSDSVHLTPASSEAIAEYLLGSLAQGMPAAKGDPGESGAAAHAASHATGGSDPVTPASIGATSHSDFVDQVSGEIDYGGNKLPFGPDAAVKAGVVIGMAFDQSIPAAETAQYFKNGVGSPEGVVAATRGAVYLDRSGGGGIYQMTGAYANTGWVKIAPTPDTGWRLLSPENGWTGEIRLRRVGPMVHFRARSLSGVASTSSNVIQIPSGFKPGPNLPAHGMGNKSSNAQSGSDPIGAVGGGSNDLVRTFGTTASWVGGSASIEWMTNDPWPTTLPGTPA